MYHAWEGVFKFNNKEAGKVVQIQKIDLIYFTLLIKSYFITIDEDVCLFKNSEHCNCVGGYISQQLKLDGRQSTKKEKEYRWLAYRARNYAISDVLKTHENCINQHISKYHIEKYLNTKR